MLAIIYVYLISMYLYIFVYHEQVNKIQYNNSARKGLTSRSV